MSLTLLILLLPILCALAVAAGAPARKTAMLAGFATFACALYGFFTYNAAQGGYQFLYDLPIVPEWKLSFSLGMDGLSLVMILLASVVLLAAVWVTPKVDRNESLFFMGVLLIAAGAIGAFASRDLFFFYAFHELALVPTFLLIGIWGTGERQRAAWKITIYLSVGSIILLIGLLGLYQMVPAGQRTFSIPELQELAKQSPLVSPHAKTIYLLLLIGFGTLISLFPFHTWAPDAYACAPTPVAMLHAGVLKKFGLYGLIRIALPMFPEAAREWNWLLLILLTGNIIYVGLVTIAQKKLNYTLGYSSVMHMGYIFLGIAAGNQIGLNGAALLMFAHGVSIAALFAITGRVQEQTGTLEYSDLGGLAKAMPFAGLCFGFAVFAAIGLPGFANFAGEIMIFFGAFGSVKAGPFTGIQIATVLALWGVVISAVYMLRGYRAVFQGEMPRRWEGVKDIAGGARWGILLLLAVLLIVGFYPKPFTNLTGPVLAPLADGR